MFYVLVHRTGWNSVGETHVSSNVAVRCGLTETHVSSNVAVRCGFTELCAVGLLRHTSVVMLLCAVGVLIMKAVKSRPSLTDRNENSPNCV